MEKVISNVDVLYEIFQYLNLEELLKLTKVCSQFRTVIVDFIWKNKYKELEILKITQHFGLLLTNNINSSINENEVGFDYIKEDKVILNRRDVNTFLEMIINNIKLLVLQTPMLYYKPIVNNEQEFTKTNQYLLFSPLEFGVAFDKRHHFINLTSITFRHVVITERDLRLLNEASKSLETLCLDNCFNINEGPLVIGDDIKINTLQNIRNLKNFHITVFDAVDKDLSYDVYKILTKLNVLQIIVRVRNFALIDEDDIEVGRRVSNIANRCEDLTIGYFRSQRVFRKFNNLLFGNFKSLKLLKMESWALISVNEEFFKKLAKTCNQLEYLKLQNFEFNGFANVSSLKSLFLENCTGLLWREVKAMLSDMTLTTFSIMDTEYIGSFEYFKVANSLENLIVINCQRNHFKKLFDINNGQNLKRLKSLVWHDNFAQAPIYVATSCFKLKTLITEPSALLINNLYDLKRLEKLTLRVGRKIKFSKLIIILKHTNLKYFTLTKLKGPDGYDEFNEYLIDYDIYEQELIEFDDRKINLSFINLSLNNYFKIPQDFWFNLLNNNTKLILMIRYNRCLHHDHTFLKFIINHSKFPMRLKSIKICGYKMEIKEFKNNFESAIDKIKAFSNIYKVQEDNGYILL